MIEPQYCAYEKFNSIFYLFPPDPPAVKQTPNVKVKEGENVTGECNLTAGTPPLNLFWQNVKTGKFDESGKLLTITNITRYQTEYRCVANNTCGRASTTMFLDVLCKEEYIISL